MGGSGTWSSRKLCEVMRRERSDFTSALCNFSTPLKAVKKHSPRYRWLAQGVIAGYTNGRSVNKRFEGGGAL